MITPNFMVFRIHPSEYFETPSKFQACFKKLKKKKEKVINSGNCCPE